MQNGQVSDLSGFWEGRYDYGNDWQSPVSFDVDLTQSGARLSGIISEPNTFDPEAGHMLTSVLAGQVNSALVSFTKTYVGEGYAQHSVTYEGVVSEKGQRIAGRWKIGGTSGNFEMSRLSGSKEQIKEAETELEFSGPNGRGNHEI